MTIAVLVVVVGPALVWKGLQIRRDPTRLESWAVAVAIVCFAVALLLNIPRENPDEPYAVPRKFLQLGQNVAAIGALASLQLFYLSFVAQFLRRPRIGLEVAVVLGTLLALTVLTFVVPDDDGLRFAADAMRQPAVAAFYLVGGGYVAYALSTQLWWTLRYGRRLNDSVLRSAAAVTSLGALLLLIAQLLRLGAVVEVNLGAEISAGGPVLGLLLIVVGTGVLVVGLVFPIILMRLTRLRRWWISLRTYRQLDPLWRAVRHAYPEIIRPREPVDRPRSVPRPWWRRRTAHRLTMAAQLRLQQCRDGYARAARLLDADVIDDDRVRPLVAALRRCPRLDPTDPDLGPATETRRLRTISRALRKVDPAPTTREVPTWPTA